MTHVHLVRYWERDHSFVKPSFTFSFSCQQIQPPASTSPRMASAPLCRPSMAGSAYWTKTRESSWVSTLVIATASTGWPAVWTTTTATWSADRKTARFTSGTWSRWDLPCKSPVLPDDGFNISVFQQCWLRAYLNTLQLFLSGIWTHDLLMRCLNQL